MIAGAAIAVGLAQALALHFAAPGPACPPAVAVVPPAILVSQPAAEPEPDPELVVPVGRCPIDMLPAGVYQPLPDEDAAELAAIVGQWISRPDAWQPPIVYQRGVLHVESEEDRGDDPPYPRSAAAEAERVCSSAASWLRDHVRERLTEVDGLRCDNNVCCYAGMEYSPNGLVVFRRGEATWSLDAWVQLDVAGLSEEIARTNVAYVTTALRRLGGTRCPGEPAGHDG